MSYELPITEGGGGGRWFTGSVADGYGCNVCHSGTANLTIGVAGLPAAYVPGESYELRVRWPEVIQHVSVVLEVVDAKGAPAGSLATPRPETVPPEELCNREGLDPVPGTFITEGKSGRQFAAVIDCGARAMRLQWTAPSLASGMLSLNAGLVASNDNARVDGDASFMIRKAIPMAGVAPSEVQLSQAAGCGIAHVQAGGSGAACLLLLLGMRIVSRKRRESGP